MTARIMGHEDTEAVLNDFLWVLRDNGYKFRHDESAVIRTASDHGFDAYMVTGLFEEDNDHTWFVYVETADHMRITVLVAEGDGKPLAVHNVIAVTYEERKARGF